MGNRFPLAEEELSPAEGADLADCRRPGDQSEVRNAQNLPKKLFRSHEYPPSMGTPAKVHFFHSTP